jgi:hypothetical protein
MADEKSSARDWWPWGLAAAHLLHTLCFAVVYPEIIYDPDLVAYFVYWKNLVTGTTSLHDASYFTVPKPLLVFLLGPLDSAQLAFAVSALAGALFGALVYLIAKRVFGRTTAVLCSLVLLLDVDRATLTARASADFFVALFLYASIWLALERRYRWSGLAIALAALVKPVALPCVVYLVVVQGEDHRRAWTGAALALVALPLTLLSNQLLLGSPFGSERFFAGFAAMSDGAQMPTGDLVRFVLWVTLAKTIFTATAAFGVLGLVIWIGRDRSRLTHPFLLVPLALLVATSRCRSRPRSSRSSASSSRCKCGSRASSSTASSRRAARSRPSRARSVWARPPPCSSSSATSRWHASSSTARASRPRSRAR